MEWNYVAFCRSKSALICSAIRWHPILWSESQLLSSDGQFASILLPGSWLSCIPWSTFAWLCWTAKVAIQSLIQCLISQCQSYCHHNTLWEHVFIHLQESLEHGEDSTLSVISELSPSAGNELWPMDWGQSVIIYSNSCHSEPKWLTLLPSGGKKEWFKYVKLQNVKM